MFDTYEEIFEKRADSYHKAMKAFPFARQQEFEWAVKYLQLIPDAVKHNYASLVTYPLQIKVLTD